MAVIKVDLSTKLGAFKPVNGIDNGPVCFGSLIDSSRCYRQAAFPYCRLHDTNYPHPREVDIPAIFRDFSADADDPKSYDFRATDIYLQEIAATGAQIIYRLGVSIEHPQLKYFVDPPSDYNKWARVCLNIARHYNEGWANGFHMNIRYWEVWNEPDMLHDDRKRDLMWSGTPEQYYELYAVTAKLFKNAMPSVRIGGYASCGLQSERKYRYFTDFLQYVRDHHTPLDFFSWHTYASRLDDIREGARLAREGLDQYGFADAESILDEWNYLPLTDSGWFGETGILGRDGAQTRREVFEAVSGESGAAFTAAALIDMLDMPIDIATLYDGQPTNIFGTIFDHYGVPTKQFYAFDAFNRMKQAGGRVSTECGIPGVHVTAAGDARMLRVLAANWGGITGTHPLCAQGLDPDAEYRYGVWRLDRLHTLEMMAEHTGKPSELPDTLYLPQNSVVLVCFDKL